MISHNSITIALGLGLISGFAAADQVEMHFDQFGGNERISIGVDGRISDANSTAGLNYINGITAGERLWTNQYGAEVVTYCIQVYESVSVGETCSFSVHEDLTMVPESPPYPGAMNSTQAGLVEDLYSRFIDGRTGFLADSTSLTDEYDNDTASAAFQLVVWEIVNEAVTDGSLDDARNELSMTMGAFRAGLESDGDVEGAVDTILSALGEDGWMNTGGSMRGLSNPSRQDQLMIVPLPLPGVLAGIGLAGAMLMRRKLSKG
jgi:hypothetical protein